MPDQRSEPRPLAPPRPTPGARLRCAWFWLVTFVAMAVMTTIQVISHRFRPTPENFKRNIGAWGRIVFRAVGIRLRVIQRAPLRPDQPYVFVANHQNSLDIMALAAGLPVPFGFVAKAELRKVPFLGAGIRTTAVFLDRGDARSAARSLREAGERIRAGTSVLIFPEGSRSHRRELQAFKKGAFLLAMEAGVPLVPVAILDAWHLMDEQRAALRPGTLRLVIGEPIDIAGRRRQDMPAVMDEVAAVLRAELARAHG